MKKWLLPVAAISMILSAPVYAEDVYTWKPDAEKRFKTKDLNHDGTITKEEFLHPYTAGFNRIDQNGDGQISMDEMRLYLKNKKPKHVSSEQWTMKSDRHFSRKDANKDNVISKDEYMRKHHNSFKGYDRDADENISKEEMRIYWETERAKLEKAKKGDEE